MVNTYETIGIGVSIAAMALALFLLRVDSNAEEKVAVTGDTQVAAVNVANEGDLRANLGTALDEASALNGDVAKLIIDDVVLGTGEEVKSGDVIEVSYVGTLQNGQEFDNSYKRGQTFSFTVGEGKVIKGWDEGVVGMKKGGQRVLVIPSDYAYGDDGFGPIPGGATLVFLVELVSISQ